MRSSAVIALKMLALLSGGVGFDGGGARKKNNSACLVPCLQDFALVTRYKFKSDGSSVANCSVHPATQSIRAATFKPPWVVRRFLATSYTAWEEMKIWEGRARGQSSTLPLFQIQPSSQMSNIRKHFRNPRLPKQPVMA